MKTPSHDPSVWSRIAPYLDRALDLDPADRETWFAELTTTHPDIAQAVHEMLLERAILDAKGFLAVSPAASIASLEGTRIGAYTIDRLIGRGGMGEVWLATRSDGRFEGKCAIKFLDAAVASSKLADRFRREGHLLARLTHLNIARLIDAGATEGGRPYLALEYVDGERIDHYCESKSLSIEARVRLFVDVVAAVAHAHTHLIIHRDLKPSNVLVTADGQVKLLDFGIAKLLGAEQIASDGLTRIEDAALTPEYAAPEQMLGETPSTATDVYQLGMLLYVLLTGKHPLSRMGTRAEKMRAALDGVVPHASEFADLHLRKKLQGDLDAILAMALRKVPGERYATAQALQDELLRYLNHEPVQARRGATWYRARKFVGRHRFAVATSTVAAVSLSAALVFALVKADEAEQERDQSRFEAARAQASGEFMTLMLSESGGDRPPTMLALLMRAEEMLDKQYGGDPSFVSSMLIELARRYLDIGRADKALTILERSTKIAQQLNDDALLASALCAAAHARFHSASTEPAASELARAAAALTRVQHPSLELRVSCLRANADWAKGTGDLTQALAFLQTARELQERVGATRQMQYTSVLTGMGGIYLYMGRLPEAYTVTVQVIESFDRNGRGGTVGKLVAEQNLAVVLNRMGEVLAASRLQEQIIQRSAALESAQTSHLPLLINYADSLVRLERFDVALNLLQRVEEQARIANKPSTVAMAKLHAGGALLAKANPIEAEARFSEAEAIWQKEPERNALLLQRLALTRMRKDLVEGNQETARQRVDALLVKLNYPQQQSGAALFGALSVAAHVYLQVGQPQMASDYASAAYGIAQRAARRADQSADVGEAALRLTQARLQLNDRQSALEFANSAVVSLSNSLGADHSLTRDALALESELRP